MENSIKKDILKSEMTLRDHFASLIMPKFVKGDIISAKELETIAWNVYRMADALLAERNKIEEEQKKK